MRVKKIKKIPIRENLSKFEVLVEKNHKLEKFTITRFGYVIEEDIKGLIESCNEFYEIFYIDDSRYSNLDLYYEYKERFPDFQIK